MVGMRLGGEVGEIMGKAAAPQGRILSAEEIRRANDLAYALFLAGGYSPGDAHRILSLRRSRVQRWRAKRKLSRYAPEIVESLVRLVQSATQRATRRQAS